MKTIIVTQNQKSLRSNTSSRITYISIFSIFSIFFGAVLATAFVPEYLNERSSLFTSSVFMTVGLMSPLAVQVGRDLRDLLRVENFVMIGLVYWLMLDMLQSAYVFELVSQNDVQWAYAMVALFAIFVWLGTAGRGWRLPQIVARSASMQLTTSAMFTCLCVAFLLGMAKFAIAARFDPSVMISGLGMSRWSAPWARGQFGGSDAIVDHLQYFGYIVPALTAIIGIRKGLLSPYTVCGVVLSVIMALFLAQGGGRRVIGVAFGAALLTWIAASPKLRPKVAIIGVTASASILWFMQEMLRYRNVGFAAWWKGERPELAVQYLHVDDNFLRLSQLIRFYPEQIEFVSYQPIFHAITLPIPRFLWSGKPTGPGFDTAAMVGKQGVALTSSILGELWVSFGVFAIMLGGFLLGRIGGMWNKILQLPDGNGRALIFGLGLMAVFAGLRSMQAMVQMSYIVLAVLLIFSMVALPKRRRRM